MLPLSKYPANHIEEEQVEYAFASALMTDIYRKALTLAGLDKHLIIVGEIGSGKKRLGRFIHKHSDRKNAPFYCFYCIDIEESDYKEAFWEQIEVQGSHIVLSYRALEDASGGFLFLDQFSELKESFMLDIIESYQQGCHQLFKFSPSLSPRLLISINRESYRNLLTKPLWNHLQNLLQPLMIMVPPLRERREDIPDLIKDFLKKIRNTREQWFDLTISDQAIDACINYNWPGNIHQLKNALLQGAVLSNGKQIEVQHLPFSLNWRLPYRLGKD